LLLIYSFWFYILRSGTLAEMCQEFVRICRVKVRVDRVFVSKTTGILRYCGWLPNTNAYWKHPDTDAVGTICAGCSIGTYWQNPASLHL